MSILALFFIGGLTLKGVLILINSSINRLSLKYNTKINLHPSNDEHDDFILENKIEMQVVSNSLKPLGKQIHIRRQRNPTTHEIQTYLEMAPVVLNRVRKELVDPNNTKTFIS